MNRAMIIAAKLRASFEDEAGVVHAKTGGVAVEYEQAVQVELTVEQAVQEVSAALKAQAEVHAEHVRTGVEAVEYAQVEQLALAVVQAMQSAGSISF